MTERCPHCGVKLDAGSAKCGFCGAPLDIPNGEPPQFPPIPALYPSALWYSWILSPAFGCWCCWRNAKILGNREMGRRARVAFLIFLGSSVAMLLILIPCGLREIFNASMIVMWLVYFFAVHRPLVGYIKKSDITYRKKSFFLPVLIALGLTIAVAAVMIGIMIISADS